MSQTRNTILTRLRAGDWSQNNEIKDRISAHARGPLPALKKETLVQFISKMTANSASVDSVNSDVAIVDSIKGFLNQHELPLSLCVVAHPALNDLPWSPDMTAEQRKVSHTDLTTLSVASAALAETGSVVMLSGNETPTEANFLPDNFICIVNKADIINYMEELWDRLRQQGDTLPGVVNIISGPSRTADVEQTIQLGAHGPRRMHVIIKE
ncbi:MAG: LUD domain-containing protein [Gammaproteobacteria bacterium]|nr:LUD domain-containing protein [Gammaproteobacteria bacterium]